MAAPEARLLQPPQQLQKQYKKTRRRAEPLPIPLFQRRPDLEATSRLDASQSALEKSTERMKFLLFIGVALIVAIQTLASHFYMYGEVPRSITAHEKAQELTQETTQEPAANASQVWPARYWKTENFSTSVLESQTTGPVAPGYLFYGVTYLNATTDSAPTIATSDDDLVYQATVENAVINNVLVQEFEGQSFLTYWVGQSVGNVGRGYGGVHFYDEKYQQQYYFCDQIPPLVTLGNHKYDCYIDSHESLVTPKGTLLVTAYNITRADLTAVGSSADGWIVDCLFYEIDIKSGSVVFQWSALEHQDQIPITSSHAYTNRTSPPLGTTQDTAWDYFHINSVAPLDDGYIVNSRHLWTFFKLSSNGSVEWRVEGQPGKHDLSNFTLSPEVSFSWQHDPRAVRISSTEVQVSLFDNNNNADYPPSNSTSSGQLLLVNEETKQVSLIRKLYTPENPLVSVSQGNYDAIEADDPVNSHALLGFGSLPIFQEYDQNGNLVYNGQFGAVGNIDSYRAYKKQWTGQPTWSPKIFAQVVDGRVQVWASWNGATEYNRWEILAGTAPNTLRRATRGRRDGFETQFTLVPRNVKYVQAVALQGNDVLGKSEVVQVAD